VSEPEGAVIYQLARGPLLWLAAAVFVVGIIYRVVELFGLTRKRGAVAWPTRNVREDSPEERKLRPIIAFQHSLISTHPVMAVVSGLFHLCIFAAPLLAKGHSYLLREAWGISLWSLPNPATDVLTIIVLAGAVLLLARRAVVPRVRAVSSVEDYVLLLITVAPYLTGFLAYHQLLPYRTIIILHMLTGEAMLIAIPFTKLRHMVFFFFVRGLVESEHGVGRGGRVWSR
jgi:nitrate reductase gamma subunit